MDCETVSFESMYFEITRDCNQRCKHCFVDAGGYNDHFHIDFSSFIRIINNFKKQGGKSIFITGGEPFTRSDIFVLLDYLEKNNIYFRVATNSYAISESDIFKLSKYKYLLSMYTSIFGSNSKEHNEIASCDSFKNVMKNIILYNRYSLKVIVQVTLRRGFYYKISEIASILEKYNCLMKFTPIAHTGLKSLDKNNRGLIVPEEEYASFIESYKAAKKTHKNIIYEHNLVNYKKMKEYIDYFDQFRNYSITPHSLVLLPDGLKLLFINSLNNWSFGYGTDNITIPIDTYYLDYVNTIRRIDLKILEILKNKEIINYEEYFIKLLRQSYKYFGKKNIQSFI